ncbi:MAG: hypothetical protein H6R06_3009 [Proteobacteria bacterium]|jgi:hypothetical protein|nr:hypothetical protein [Pseudomonadota bacterium]
MSIAHDVFNQAPPLAHANLFQLNSPLQDGLAWHHTGYDGAGFDAAEVCGLLPARTDVDAILQRAMPSLH